MNRVKVNISNNQKAAKIPSGIRLLIRRCCHAVLEEENFDGMAEVSVSFVDNERIHELNKQFRNIDRPTDVLSFPLGENGVYDTNMDSGAKLLGDVNCSGKVDVSDAVLLARFVAEDVEANVTAQGKLNGDVNADENLTSDDVIGILRIIAKLDV
jgi:probable rRNA maturation factor